MLNVNSGIVCSIIDKARQFFGKEEIVIPEDAKDMSDDWYYEILADFKGDLTLAELKSAILDLEPDQQACLVALLWVGRGDYDKSEWDSACEEAVRNWTPKTADYLLSKPFLADYLEEGLVQLGYSCD